MTEGPAGAIAAAERTHVRLRAVLLGLWAAGGLMLLSYLSHVASGRLPVAVLAAIWVGLAAVVALWRPLAARGAGLPWAALVLWAAAVGVAVFPHLSQTQLGRAVTALVLAAVGLVLSWLAAAVWRDRRLRRRLGPVLAGLAGLRYDATGLAANPLHAWLDPGAPRFSARDGLAGEAAGLRLQAARIRCYKQGRYSETLLEGPFCRLEPWLGAPMAALREASAGIDRAVAAGLRRQGGAAGLVLVAGTQAGAGELERFRALAEGAARVAAGAGATLHGIVAADGAVQVVLSQAADPFRLGGPLTRPATLRVRLEGAFAAVELPLRLAAVVAGRGAPG